MRVYLKIDDDNFDGKCEAILHNVEAGTKTATTQACKSILSASLLQVPLESGTLYSSGFYDVRRRSDIKSHRFEGIIGYGGNGDPVNPRTGQRASDYMVTVHEDLTAYHDHGKAKFLEDPVVDFGEKNFKRVAIEHIGNALSKSVK